MNMNGIADDTLQTDPAVATPSRIKTGQPISSINQLHANRAIDLKGTSRPEPNLDIHPIIDEPDFSQFSILGLVVLYVEPIFFA
jgi:hypothetical protein